MNGKRMRRIVLGFVVSSMVPAWICLAQTSASDDDCPLLAITPGVRMEVTDILFAPKVSGSPCNASYENDAEKLAKFRYAIVTVKVTKREGQSLTIAGADFTLHYGHREGVEAAPCNGISEFGKAEDEDRAFTIQTTGVGFTKKTTGPRATQSGTVYFDLCFSGIERDAKKFWLCIASPITQQPKVLAKGWGE